MSRGSFERGSKYGQDIQHTDNGIELPDKRWVEALINDNLEALDHSLRGAEVRRAA